MLRRWLYPNSGTASFEGQICRPLAPLHRTKDCPNLKALTIVAHKCVPLLALFESCVSFSACPIPRCIAGQMDFLLLVMADRARDRGTVSNKKSGGTKIFKQLCCLAFFICIDIHLSIPASSFHSQPVSYGPHDLTGPSPRRHCRPRPLKDATLDFGCSHSYWKRILPLSALCLLLSLAVSVASDERNI